jgi:PIN domain nuclease of toxin-antitoxin system
MKYIVDTHALIWFLEGNSRLGENAKNVLSPTNFPKRFSACSGAKGGGGNLLC